MVNEKTVISVRAHKAILEMGIMDDDLIDLMFQKIKSMPISDLLAYRICSIIENYTKHHPFSTIENFSRIAELLSYCDHQSVVDLFRILSCSSVQCMMQTRFLQCIDVPHVIVNLLNEMNDVDECTYQISGLYTLVQAFSENEFLRLRFQTDTALSVITKEYDNINGEVLNHQWRAILALFDVDTVPFLEDLIPRAVENIKREHETFSEYQTISIDLLRCLVNHEDNYLIQLFEMSLPQVLITLMEKFPLHTILHQSISSFIKVSLKSDMVQQTVDAFFDFVVNQYNNSKVQVLHASCFYILKKFYSCEEGKEKIKSIEGLEANLTPLFQLMHESHANVQRLMRKRDYFN